MLATTLNVLDCLAGLATLAAVAYWGYHHHTTTKATPCQTESVDAAIRRIRQNDNGTPHTGRGDLHAAC